MPNIAWCLEMKQNYQSNYGLGDQLDKEKVIKIKAFPSLEQQFECDLCGKQVTRDSLFQINNSVRLCLNCFEHMQKIPDGLIKDCILKSLDGNVF